MGCVEISAARAGVARVVREGEVEMKMVESSGGCEVFVLVGPPGAGKGVQARRLHEGRGLLRVSTGDLLRDEVRTGSTRGRRIGRRIDAGHFADDETVFELVAEVLDRHSSSPILLDGFPRNVEQARRFEEILQRSGRRLGAVIAIETTSQVALARLSGRLVCGRCGTSFHSAFRRPRHSARCDECGGPLATRVDDAAGAEVLRERLEIYDSVTRPILALYESRGLLRRVDGDASVEEVSRRIDELLAAPFDGDSFDLAN